MFGLGPSDAAVMIIALFVVFAPFLINASLAKSRGKSVALILLLTVIFSWVVTLILAFIPKTQESK